jgi:succinate dehydrogenase / fumarate reductase iron-sulfur subunit
MRINDQNMLACTTLVSRIAKPGSQELKVQVEPILGLKVIKDLVVDMDPFFDHYKSVQPYFINDTPLPANGRERLQSPEDRARFDDSTKCILCAACTTSCPSFWANDKYVGPAAIVQAHRFIFDSRDQGAEKRLNVLGDSFGVWRCRTIFNCTNACPRDIKVTQAIAEVKKALTSGEI